MVPNEGKYFQSLNRGKRSLTVDLQRSEGRKLIHRLLPRFDVVLINYRAGVAARLGIDYPTLSGIKPGLIYASITGFGEGGPFAERAGSDIVAKAYSGLMASEAEVDEHGAPRQSGGTTVIDRASGLAAAMGICAALFHRQRTGDGQELNVSLLHTGLELLSNQVMREPVHDVTLRDPMLHELQERRAAGVRYDELASLRKAQGPRFAAHRLFYGGYHTAEGALVLGGLTRQNRDVIREVIGSNDETDDSDFDAADPVNRQKMEDWRSEIQAKLLRKSAAEWVEELVQGGAPASVVNFPEEMADDPQVVAMGMMGDLVHPVTGPQRVVSPIVRMSKSPTRLVCSAPALAAHSREVLTEAGLSPAEIEELKATGTITTDD